MTLRAFASFPCLRGCVQLGGLHHPNFEIHFFCKRFLTFLQVSKCLLILSIFPTCLPTAALFPIRLFATVCGVFGCDFFAELPTYWFQYWLTYTLTLWRHPSCIWQRLVFGNVHTVSTLCTEGIALSVFSGTQALNNSELLARSRELQLVELAVGHYLRFADQCASQSDQRLRSAYCDSSEHRFPDELKHSLADGLSVGFLLWQYDRTRSACHVYSLALSVCQLCQLSLWRPWQTMRTSSREPNTASRQPLSMWPCDMADQTYGHMVCLSYSVLLSSIQPVSRRVFTPLYRAHLRDQSFARLCPCPPDVMLGVPKPSLLQHFCTSNDI